MPRYTYTARDTSGRTVSAEQEASSRREALRVLQARGLQPLQLNETGAAKTGSKAQRAAAQIEFTRKETLPFFTALSELTHSGLSAGEAVRLLSQRLKEKRLRALSAALWDRLSEGQTLSRAMADFPATFDRQAVSLLQAAEATGSLNEVLERLITHYTEQKALRQKLTTALAYPLFICTAAIAVVILFVTVPLPRMEGLLKSMGPRLPMTTQMLMGVAHQLPLYGGLCLLAVVTGAISFWRWRKTEAGRRQTDAWLASAPWLRNFVIDAAMLNFSSILAVLLENGIPTAEALRLTERTVANLTLRAGLHNATDRVLEGEALSTALARTGWFPDLIVDRLAVGESTGKLAPCLRDISRSYAVAYTRRLETLTKVIIFTLLAVTYSFVAFIAVAIVSAVLQLSAGFRF